MGVMVGLIVQANSLSVSLGQKYRMMNATTRKGIIKAASQRVSGKMRSSCAKPDELKKARLLLISFIANLLFIIRNRNGTGIETRKIPACGHLNPLKKPGCHD